MNGLGYQDSGDCTSGYHAFFLMSTLLSWAGSPSFTRGFSGVFESAKRDGATLLVDGIDRASGLRVAGVRALLDRDTFSLSFILVCFSVKEK